MGYVLSLHTPIYKSTEKKFKNSEAQLKIQMRFWIQMFSKVITDIRFWEIEMDYVATTQEADWACN